MLTVREHLRQVLRYMQNASITFDVYLEEFEKQIEVTPGDPDTVFDLMDPKVINRNGEEGVTLSPRRVIKARPFYPALRFAEENGWRVTRIDLFGRTIHFTKGA